MKKLFAALLVSAAMLMLGMVTVQAGQGVAVDAPDSCGSCHYSDTVQSVEDHVPIMLNVYQAMSYDIYVKNKTEKPTQKTGESNVFMFVSRKGIGKHFAATL